MPTPPIAQAMPPNMNGSLPPAAGRQQIEAAMQRGSDGTLQGAHVGGRHVVFIRDPDTQRIISARIIEDPPTQTQGKAPIPPGY
jgi:hypothetical protein